MKELLIILLLFTAVTHQLSAQNSQTACTQNYQLACAEERRLLAEKKALECRLLAIQTDKQTLIACIAADQNKAELNKLKSVLISTLNEVERLQSQPLKLPTPCAGGNCN